MDISIPEIQLVDLSEDASSDEIRRAGVHTLRKYATINDECNKKAMNELRSRTSTSVRQGYVACIFDYSGSITTQEERERTIALSDFFCLKILLSKFLLFHC